jgi:hypothetical protein
MAIAITIRWASKRSYGKEFSTNKCSAAYPRVNDR